MRKYALASGRAASPLDSTLKVGSLGIFFRFDFPSPNVRDAFPKVGFFQCRSQNTKNFAIFPQSAQNKFSRGRHVFPQSRDQYQIFEGVLRASFCCRYGLRGIRYCFCAAPSPTRPQRLPNNFPKAIMTSMWPTVSEGAKGSERLFKVPTYTFESPRCLTTYGNTPGVLKVRRRFQDCSGPARSDSTPWEIGKH